MRHVARALFAALLWPSLALAQSFPVLDPSGDVANTGGARGKLLLKAGVAAANLSASMTGDCGITSLGVIVCTRINGVPAGALATQNVVNLTTQGSGTLQANQAPAFTGDVTTSQGSLSTTISAGAVTASKLASGAAAANLGFTPAYSANVTDAQWAGGASPSSSAAQNTAAINAALASGAFDVVVPAGTYPACGIVIPTTSKLHFHGQGPVSNLQEASGCSTTLLAFPNPGGALAYPYGVVSDLQLSSVSGAAATLLSTQGIGGEDFDNIVIGSIPAGYDGIFVNGTTVNTHDIQLHNLKCFSPTAGRSCLHFGAKASDSKVDGFEANGSFSVSYIELFDAGSNNIQTSNTHIYNAATNVVNIAGTSALPVQYLQFTNNTFDNAAAGDIFSASYLIRSVAANNYIETINAGYNGISLANSTTNSFSNTLFETSGANAAINESGTSDYNAFLGGYLGTTSLYTNVLNFTGANSLAKFFPKSNPLGVTYGFSGASASPQAQNTTAYLGVNGAQSASLATEYVAPYAGNIKSVYVALGTTPAAGQTYTFTLYDGGTSLGSCVVTNGSFTCAMTLTSTAVSANDPLWIQSVSSATSGSSYIRYNVSIQG